jgi:hypothetical protein
MKFVVTGTGRCGTGFTARLMTAAGLNCGHEQAFRPRPAWGERAAFRGGLKAPLARVREGLRRSRLQLDGDASWMAVPRLHQFAGVKFLQTRDPIAVIRSFTGTRFFSDPTRNVAQRAYAMAHFSVVGDDVVDTMRWWVFWNRLARRHADLTYRLEDLDQAMLAIMLSMLDIDEPEARATSAFASLGDSRVNSGADRGELAAQLNWSDLPSGQALDELVDAAIEFGYSPG